MTAIERLSKYHADYWASQQMTAQAFKRAIDQLKGEDNERWDKEEDQRSDR